MSKTTGTGIVHKCIRDDLATLVNTTGNERSLYMISPWKYHQSMKKMKSVLSKDNYPHLIYLSLINYNLHATVVRDSSAVRRLLWTCCSRGTSESSTYRKQQIFPPNLGQHISTFRGYLILFSIRNPYINRFTNHFSIHS